MCNANLAIDPANCGKCGRGCLGGTCAAGQCSIRPLVETQPKPSAIALDATSVYFVNSDSSELKKMNKDGTGVVTLLTMTEGVDNPQAIATDGTNLFWSNYNTTAARTVRRANLTAVSSIDVGPSNGTFAGFVAMGGGGRVVWTNRTGPNHIYKADLNGSNMAVVATGNFELGWVAADPTDIYWASIAEGRIYKTAASAAAPCAMGGGGATPCTIVTAAATNVYGIALDASAIYFTEQSLASGAVRKIAKSGGLITTFATGQKDPRSIAVDGEHVYWGNFGSGAGSNSVRRAKLTAASPCTADTCELVANEPFPNAIALDDKAVYFVGQYANGGIYRRAK